MLVKMLIGTGGPNGTACFVGEVYDLPDGLARQWVAAGRAIPADGAPLEDPGIVTINGDPMIETTRPTRAKRTR